MHKKPLFLVKNLNVDSLDYSKISPVTNFHNLCSHHTIFLLINRPTRVSKTSAAAIHCRMTNTFLQAEVYSTSSRLELGIIFQFPTMKIIIKIENNISTRIIRKRKINESGIDSFRSLLKRIDCGLVK